MFSATVHNHTVLSATVHNHTVQCSVQQYIPYSAQYITLQAEACFFYYYFLCGAPSGDKQGQHGAMWAEHDVVTVALLNYYSQYHSWFHGHLLQLASGPILSIANDA